MKYRATSAASNASMPNAATVLNAPRPKYAIYQARHLQTIKMAWMLRHAVGMCRTEQTGASPAGHHVFDARRVAPVIGRDRADGTFQTRIKGRSIMASGKSDELKGRVKEAAGVLTDDKKLKREGQVDQAAGHFKQKVEKVVDKVKDAVR